MKTINVLVRGHSLQQLLHVDVLGQWQLNQNSIDVVARIQLLHQCQHLAGCNALGRRQHLAVDSQLAAGLYFASNVNL